MSTQVFPNVPYPGQAFSITRSPVWSTDKQYNVSGKEVSASRWSYPIYEWTLAFNVLRQGSVAGVAQTEMASLMGFFNARNGGYDSFLYQDSIDNSVTDQAIGAGTGSQTVFQLVRNFGVGGISMPIFAPNAVTAVKLNGVTQSGGSYTITSWGTVNANGPGKIIFNTAPGSGVLVTATYSYYFPCLFAEDACEFNKTMQGYYEVKKLVFRSLK